MALARVVSFGGVDADRVAQLAGEIESGQPPEGMPPAEFMLLHDPEADQALAIIIVDSEDDYAKAHAVLDAMPTEGTPGTRASVTKYHVAARMS